MSSRRNSKSYNFIPVPGIDWEIALVDPNRKSLKNKVIVVQLRSPGGGAIIGQRQFLRRENVIAYGSTVEQAVRSALYQAYGETLIDINPAAHVNIAQLVHDLKMNEKPGSHGVKYVQAIALRTRRTSVSATSPFESCCALSRGTPLLPR